MRAILLAWISLISLGFGGAISFPAVTLKVKPGDLRGVLNWLHEYHKAYKPEAESFRKVLLELGARVDLPEYEDIGETLDEVLQQTAILRNRLVRGEIDDITITNPYSEFITAIHYIGIMKDHFAEFFGQMKMWFVEPGFSRNIIRVTRTRQYAWFKTRGFNSRTLNDIAVSEVNVLVKRICGDYNNIGHILSFAGILAIQNPPLALGAKMAWLYELVESEETRAMIKERLTTEGNYIPAEQRALMLDAMSKFGSRRNPLYPLLWNVLEVNVEYRSPTLLYNYSHILDRHLPRYLAIAIGIIENLQNDLIHFEAELRAAQGDELIDILTRNDFVFTTTLDAKSIAEKVRELIDANGIVKTIWTALEGTAERRIDFDTASPTTEAASAAPANIR